MRSINRFAWPMAATLALVAAPAMAQDIPFNGPRIGVIAGYDGIRPGSSEDSDIQGDDQTVDGFQYGVDAGYDVNLGSAVVGVEGEWTDSTAKSDRYDLTDQFGFGRVSQGRDLYIGARAGILANPATLVYVKGGYTNSKLNILAGNTDETTDRSFKLDGWRIGAGVERAINTNTFAKLEYRYSNYTDAHIDYMDGATSADFDVDTDRHQVVASVGWRF